MVRIVGACFAGALVALASLPLGARASTPNAWDEFTVRTVNGSYGPDAGTASTTSAMSGGEPSVAFDSARNAALYGSGLNVKRLTWNVDTQAPTMTDTDVKPTTSDVTTLDAITARDPFRH